ncbi:hypothetical protein [Desulfofustis glycolicus]|nr:hypothetical protein [Desulfofustis glycolicus]MCB2216471.1 hypothetical protein [Desulfobulbaceae bacterium]
MAAIERKRGLSPVSPKVIRMGIFGIEFNEATGQGTCHQPSSDFGRLRVYVCKINQQRVRGDNAINLTSLYQEINC